MKRKEKVEKMEKERFELNMAQMIGVREAGPGTGTGPGTETETGAGPGTGTKQMETVAHAGDMGETAGTAERWKALRGFIEQTLERRGDGMGRGGVRRGDAEGGSKKEGMSGAGGGGGVEGGERRERRVVV